MKRSENCCGETCLNTDEKEQTMLKKDIPIINTNIKQYYKTTTPKYANCQTLTNYTMVYKYIISLTQIQAQRHFNGNHLLLQLEMVQNLSGNCEDLFGNKYSIDVIA